MPIPGTQEIRKPLLEAFRGEAPHNFINSEILELIAEYFRINLNDLSSGEKNILKSGINDAKADLKKNGLIYNPSGNTYMITIAGTKVLEDNPEIITDEYLRARKKKPLPVAETFGLEMPETDKVNEIQESKSEPETLHEDEVILETKPEPEVHELEPEPENMPEDEVIPESETEVPEVESEPDALPEDEATETESEPRNPELEPELETLPEDEALENETELEVHEVTPEPETLPKDEATETESEPRNPELEPELETLPEDEAIPETETELEVHELEPEPETLPEDEAFETEPEVEVPEVEPDALLEDEATETESEPEVHELESEPETLTEDEAIPEAELELGIPEVKPEPDTLTEDEAIPESETESEIPEVEPEPGTLTEESLLEPETLPEDEPIPESDTESEPENLPEPMSEDTPTLDDSDDIHLDDEPEEQDFNDAPEENLDTEEDTDTMPEELYEAPTEPELEEEYNSALLAAAMSTNSIDDAIARHNSELADELLMKAAGLPSDRFEMLVIDLLSKMGYFAFQTARYTTESSGSDLIHGVILDNQTGANIYIQARKLSPGRTIGKADIQDFIDELSDKGGKGIYATTASFSENAKILATDERIMLIDGEKLANLMIANNFCVNVEKVYEIKAIDSESFSEYED